MTTKSIRIASSFTFFLILAFSSQSQILPRLPQVSPLSTISQTIGITEVSVTYSRPFVGGRKIWGGLVPNGYVNNRPWRTGANNTTTIEFTHPVTINGKLLDAGRYGLFMAVFDNETADVIITHDHQSFGPFFYKPEMDALRFNVKAEEVSFKEMMTFEFFDVTNDSATLALIWEKKKIPFSIAVNTNQIVHEHLLARQNSAESFDDSWHFAAANYSMNNNVFLKDGIRWAENTLSPNFGGLRNMPNLTTLANLLLLDGQSARADTLLTEALNLEGLSKGIMNFYAGQVQGLGFPDIALRVWKRYAVLFPKDEWNLNNGLARAYSAKRNFKEAIKHLEKAYQHAPENYDTSTLDKNIDKLKQGQDIN